MESFSLALNESSDSSHAAQLLIIIRSVTESFKAVEELGSLESLHGTTTEEDLFLSACELMKEFELLWTVLKGLQTDGDPRIFGKEICLVDRIMRELEKQNLEFFMKLHCIIQRSIFGDTLQV